MKIWIEYQHRFENGDKGDLRVYFLNNPDEIYLTHGHPIRLFLWNSGKYRDLNLQFIEGLIIEPDETSEIEIRMADHIMKEWKKIGE